MGKWQKRYGEKIAAWCEDKLGKCVGNGECWTLADEALKGVGAMPCQSYTHGALLYVLKPGSPSKLERVKRGDVIQFWNARFESKDGRRRNSAGRPGHTSVVTGVEEGGEVVKVVEQNVRQVKVVLRGEYRLWELVAGEVRISRAVPVEWVGVFDMDRFMRVME